MTKSLSGHVKKMFGMVATEAACGEVFHGFDIGADLYTISDFEPDPVLENIANSIACEY